MEQNQVKIEEMQEPEGLPMAAAVLEAIARAAQDDEVYKQVFEIVRGNIDDENLRASVTPDDARMHITSTTALVVSIGTAIAMLRQTPSTVLVNLCGMLLARMQSERLADIGFVAGGVGHKQISKLILDRTREIETELLDGVRTQSIH